MLEILKDFKDLQKAFSTSFLLFLDFENRFDQLEVVPSITKLKWAFFLYVLTAAIHR